MRATGVWHAVGEVVTCPFCLAPWLTATYIGALIVAPRAARTAAAGFAIIGISDWIQQGYDKIKS